MLCDGAQLSCRARARAIPHRRARVGHGHQPAGAARHRPRARGGDRGGRLERRGGARRSSAPRARGVPTAVFPRRTTPTARARRGAGRLAAASAARGWWCSPATWSCSASAFLARFPGAVINVHPSLLPGVPRARAIEQALAYGVKVFGVTVHFVDAGVDTGPVILQRAVELPDAREPERGAGRAAPARARAAARGGAAVRARRAAASIRRTRGAIVVEPR